jgi:hypothetical protein
VAEPVRLDLTLHREAAGPLALQDEPGGEAGDEGEEDDQRKREGVGAWGEGVEA